MKNNWITSRRWKMAVVPVLAFAIGIGALIGAIGSGKNEVHALENVSERSTITVSGNGSFKQHQMWGT